MKIYPSLISADLLRLRDVIVQIDPFVDGYHIDIMDDHFVPNLTWGPAFVAALRLVTSKPFQLHLMVDNPEKWVTRLAWKKGDSFVFHIEAVKSAAVHSLIDLVLDHDWDIGIALNPATDVSCLGVHLSRLHEILIMSVEPGFSGQGFINTLFKVEQIKQLSSRLGVECPRLCMDGGIGQKNIASIAAAGIELIGAASAIFNDASNPVDNINVLKKIAADVCGDVK